MCMYECIILKTNLDRKLEKWRRHHGSNISDPEKSKYPDMFLATAPHSDWSLKYNKKTNWFDVHLTFTSRDHGGTSRFPYLVLPVPIPFIAWLSPLCAFPIIAKYYAMLQTFFLYLPVPALSSPVSCTYSTPYTPGLPPPCIPLFPSLPPPPPPHMTAPKAFKM